MERRYMLSEVAVHWNCSERTVQREIRAGRLACVKVGKLVRITKEQLEEYDRLNSKRNTFDIDAAVMARTILSGVA